MMHDVTVPDLISRWPSRKDLAEDLRCVGDDVTVDRIHKWIKSRSIPARYHARMIRSALARGFCVTADELAAAHDREPEEGAA